MIIMIANEFSFHSKITAMLPGIDLCTMTSLSSMIMLLNSYPIKASIWLLLKHADWPSILLSLNRQIRSPATFGYLTSKMATSHFPSLAIISNLASAKSIE